MGSYKHQYIIDEYRVEIFDDKTYTCGSLDNINQYDFIYVKELDYRCSSIFGIKTFRGHILLKSAVIGSSGGATGLHATSTIVEQDRLVVCCSDTIFCLYIPDLVLLWQTKADEFTCFEIFKHHDSYIIHGELSITRLDKKGKISWQQSGADIFTTIEGKDDFIITDDYILAADWGNRKYKFNFNGLIVE